MKRRNFLSIVGAGAGLIAAPVAIMAKSDKDFKHSPEDYAQVQEEPEEFQELDEALTDKEFAQDIDWI